MPARVLKKASAFRRGVRKAGSISRKVGRTTKKVARQAWGTKRGNMELYKKARRKGLQDPRKKPGRRQGFKVGMKIGTAVKRTAIVGGGAYAGSKLVGRRRRRKK